MESAAPPMDRRIDEKVWVNSKTSLERCTLHQTAKISDSCLAGADTWQLLLLLLLLLLRWLCMVTDGSIVRE